MAAKKRGGKTRTLKERFGGLSQREQRRRRLSSNTVTAREAASSPRESGRTGLSRLPAELPGGAKIKVRRPANLFLYPHRHLVEEVCSSRLD